jgi:tetratricopeptide (TPR) repeat protein
MTDSQHPSSGSDRKKPILSPPVSEGVRNKDNRFALLMLVIGLLSLLGVAAIVIWLLPHAANRKNPLTSQQALQLQTPTSNPDLKQTDSARAEVEKLVAEWLKLQAGAEADNVSVWGADTYPSLLEETASADQLLRERYFTEAFKTYKKAIIALQELLASKEERLASALAKGGLALENHASREAAMAFDLALAIDPNNEEASQGAARARNLDQVLLLYNKGLDYERENNLPAARQTLQQATDLDKKFSPAEEALTLVDDRLRDIAFQEAMSDVLKALAENDIVTARLSLAEAARMRPTDVSVQDAGRRLAAMEKAQKLIDLKDKAEKLAGEERWSEALRVYDEALAIDPQFGFAETGRKLAWQRFEFDRSIRQILSRPVRLQEKGPRQETEQILAKARSIDDPGPILQKQTIELAELVRAATTPVEVTLRSDNETSVIIYQIGMFGKFIEKSVTLLPGNYTLVGFRPGFRDVRLNLKVKAEDRHIFFEIRCEDPI